MLESSSDWPTREWIERAVISQSERPKYEKSAAGSRALLSARGHRRNDKLLIRSALECCEFQITRLEKKPNGYQGDGEHGGNGGGGGNGRGGAMAEEAQMTAKGAAIVAAEAIKIAAGAAVSKIKVARIPNPAIRPLGPTAIYV